MKKLTPRGQEVALANLQGLENPDALEFAALLFVADAWAESGGGYYSPWGINRGRSGNLVIPCYEDARSIVRDELCGR